MNISNPMKFLLLSSVEHDIARNGTVDFLSVVDLKLRVSKGDAVNTLWLASIKQCEIEGATF